MTNNQLLFKLTNHPKNINHKLEAGKLEMMKAKCPTCAISLLSDYGMSYMRLNLHFQYR